MSDNFIKDPITGKLILNSGRRATVIHPGESFSAKITWPLAAVVLQPVVLITTYSDGSQQVRQIGVRCQSCQSNWARKRRDIRHRKTCKGHP